MVKYIIFIDKLEADAFIQRINECMGYPNSTGTETYSISQNVCVSDVNTEEISSIGWGVQIRDYINDCLTEEEKTKVLPLPDNVCFCPNN